MKKTLGSIESFTGGLFAATITSQPGASEYFRGSIVTYHNQVKQKIGVEIDQGVINSRTALAMAAAGREWLNVDYCVAFTGNAGPQALESQPIGLVFIAINEQAFKLKLSGTRNEIQKQAVQFALHKLSFLT